MGHNEIICKLAQCSGSNIVENARKAGFIFGTIAMQMINFITYYIIFTINKYYITWTKTKSVKLDKICKVGQILSNTVSPILIGVCTTTLLIGTILQVIGCPCKPCGQK